MKVDFLSLWGGRKPAKEFMDSLDSKTVGKIYQMIETLKVVGCLSYPYARKLQGFKGLWELRLHSQQGAVRLFYIYGREDTIFLVSGFMKKSQKTPQRELKRAINYLRQIGIKL